MLNIVSLINSIKEYFCKLFSDSKTKTEMNSIQVGKGGSFTVNNGGKVNVGSKNIKK